MEAYLSALYGHVTFYLFQQVDRYVSYVAKVRTGQGTSIVGLWVPAVETLPPKAKMDQVQWVSLFTRRPYRDDPDLPLVLVGKLRGLLPMWRSISSNDKGKSYACDAEDGRWELFLAFSERVTNYHNTINLIAALETNRATIRGP